ncbi:N-acetyltransferase [Longimycelium tulufanense]|uniref:N-acetyltransferase n=1 Tax=Longimycelium tulufanense TaxID=907463 RepID=A0A8J3CID6_9PSEU|nr:GNAT family N-acetyltransferase [Longimycelium tulufanense]GGM66013.1 N-acetyltransferase [Longimycelium tulufanense]
MQPVEINTGTWYLRQIRADSAIDDRPAITAAFNEAALKRYTPQFEIPDLAAAGEYVARRAAEWERDERYSWAIAEPVSGEMVGEVGLKDVDLHQAFANASCWTHPDWRGLGIMGVALRAVLRFGFGALDLHYIGYAHAASNTSSRRVAEKCGFTLDGRLRAAALVDGAREDVLVWSRLATDP